jgi:signal transduction histidine kinase
MEQPPRLLIVDDDPFIRHLMRDLFAEEYAITLGKGGEEALEFLAQQPFDAVLLDIMMPGIGGLQALERIRQTPDHADLPVILMSARSGGSEVARGLELGASDYITKPVDIPVVRARVDSQIRLKRRLDERNREIEHLQHEQEVKDRFFRIASHDLKGPLTNIRIAQFYLRDLVGDDPDAATVLDSIETTVEAMQEVVDDFLDTAALQQGVLKLNFEAIQAADLLWDAVTRNSMSAQRKEIALTVAQTTPGTLWVDTGIAQQILGNLVSNAIKYSPSGSAVTLSSEIRGEKVRIQVADQGPGIPEDERGQLFQPFAKLSTRPTGGESSTGLGLWIASQLVTVHGGAIGAEFPAEGGSIFWVELPTSKPQPS